MNVFWCAYGSNSIELIHWKENNDNNNKTSLVNRLNSLLLRLAIHIANTCAFSVAPRFEERNSSVELVNRVDMRRVPYAKRSKISCIAHLSAYSHTIYKIFKWPYRPAHRKRFQAVPSAFTNTYAYQIDGVTASPYNLQSRASRADEKNCKCNMYIDLLILTIWRLVRSLRTPFFPLFWIEFRIWIFFRMKKLNFRTPRLLFVRTFSSYFY